MAKDKVQVPLTFELGWQRQGAHQSSTSAAQPEAPQPVLR
jgi:hypothetical protein